MKFGVNFCSEIRDYFSARQCAENFAKLGFEYLDYDLFLRTPQNKYYSMPEVCGSIEKTVEFYSKEKAIFEEYGISVNQTHAVFSNFDKETLTLNDGAVREYVNCIYATRALGAKYLVIHPITHQHNCEYEDCFEATLNMYRQLIPTLKECGVILAVENLFTYDIYRRCVPCTFSYPAQILSMIDALGDDVACACLDTGHLKICAYDHVRAVKELGKRLKVLHIHDNNSFKDLHCLPVLGEAELPVDWKGIIKALDDVGFDGVYSFELDRLMGRVGKLEPSLIFDYLALAKNIFERQAL